MVLQKVQRIYRNLREQGPTKSPAAAHPAHPLHHVTEEANILQAKSAASAEVSSATASTLTSPHGSDPKVSSGQTGLPPKSNVFGLSDDDIEVETQLVIKKLEEDVEAYNEYPEMLHTITGLCAEYQKALSSGISTVKEKIELGEAQASYIAVR